MSELKVKLAKKQRRLHRVRARIHGRAERPRLSVNVSNLHISAQIIDDDSGKTLASASTVGQKAAKGNLTEKSSWVGGEIAKKAKAAKIKKVVYDRGSKLYHGRVKALADAARENGLEL